jgi:hypothetical protein
MTIGLRRKEVLPFVTHVPRLDIARLSDLITPDMPDGFQTIPGWWATMESEAIPLLRDPMLTFYSDANALEAKCAQDGIECEWAMAPRAFRKLGLDTVRAFPTALLEEFYPAMP